MKLLPSSWQVLLGCLLGVGLAAAWPARAQQDKSVPSPPHEQVLALEVEVEHLRTLLNHELFEDVSRKHWAYAAVTALQAQGVLKGYPPGYFQGRRPLTRYEFAVAIERMRAGEPLADSRDKAAVDELAQEFHLALTLKQEGEQRLHARH